MLQKSEVGKRGEQRAAEYLESAGYEVLARNFRTRAGEIDIVARDGEMLVFVEVKSWDSFGFTELEHAIDRRKRRRIVQASRLYLARERNLERAVRYDLLFMSHGADEIRHVKGAFTERP